jgi:urease gamma subunit
MAAATTMADAAATVAAETAAIVFVVVEAAPTGKAGAAAMAEAATIPMKATVMAEVAARISTSATAAFLALTRLQ